MAKLIADESGGSPFFIDELVRSLRLADEAAVREAARRGAEDSDARELNIRDLLQLRLARLDADSHTLLRLVAINRQPIAAAVLRRAVGRRRLRRGRRQAALRASRAHARDATRARSWRSITTVSRTPSCSLIDEEISAGCTPCSPTALEGFDDSDDELRRRSPHRRGRASIAASTYLVRAADAAAKALAFDRAARLYRRAFSLERRGPNLDEHPPQARRRPRQCRPRPRVGHGVPGREGRGPRRRAGAEAQGRAASALQRPRRRRAVGRADDPGADRRAVSGDAPRHDRRAAQGAAEAQVPRAEVPRAKRRARFRSTSCCASTLAAPWHRAQLRRHDSRRGLSDALSAARAGRGRPSTHCACAGDGVRLLLRRWLPHAPAHGEADDGDAARRRAGGHAVRAGQCGSGGRCRGVAGGSLARGRRTAHRTPNSSSSSIAPA